MPRKNTSAKHKAVCSVCGGVSRLSHDDKRGLHPFLDFFCSRDCVRMAIQFGNYPKISYSRICVPPKVPVNDRTEFWHNIWFASRYDMFMAQWLTKLGERWWYEKYGFSIGKYRTYTPDFILPDRHLIIEMKGRWGSGQTQKMTQFLKQYPEVTIILVPWMLHKEFYYGDNDENG